MPILFKIPFHGDIIKVEVTYYGRIDPSRPSYLKNITTMNNVLSSESDPFDGFVVEGHIYKTTCRLRLLFFSTNFVTQVYELQPILFKYLLCVLYKEDLIKNE